MKIYLVTTEYTNSEGNDVFTIPCASKEAALRKLQECIENELFFIAKELCDGFVSEDELAKGGYFRYNSETKRYIRVCGEKDLSEYIKANNCDYLDEDFVISISQESFHYKDAYDFKHIDIYIQEEELIE